jgi:hypothetical protein
VTPARQRRRPTEHLKRLQHCAARSCPRSPPGGQAAGPGRQSGDDPGAPPRPGTWPCSSSAPPVTSARQRRRPTEHLERLQHCSSLLPAITRPWGQAAGPGRPPGDGPCLPSRPGTWPSSTPAGSDLAPPRRGRGGLTSEVPRAVAALQLAPARDHPPQGAKPPDQVAHQVMTPVCRPARGHGPAACSTGPDLAPPGDDPGAPPHLGTWP